MPQPHTVTRSLLAGILLVAGATLAQPRATRAGASDSGPALRPLLLDIEVAVPEARPRLDVEARVTFEVQRATDPVTFQLRPDFEVREVLDDSGRSLPVLHRTGQELRIASPGLVPGERHAWTFRYAWPLPAPVDELAGVYTSQPWYPHLVQRRDDGFPQWAPTRARIVAELPTHLAVAATGHLAVRRTPNGRRFTWTQGREMPLHGFALGPFHMRESHDRGLVVRGFFVDGDRKSVV